MTLIALLLRGLRKWVTDARDICRNTGQNRLPDFCWRMNRSTSGELEDRFALFLKGMPPSGRYRAEFMALRGFWNNPFRHKAALDPHGHPV
jgi:hypothetical protein